MFWSNTVWFIALGLVSAAQVLFLLWKSGDKARLLALYWVFFGMTLLVETVLFIFLHAYDYYPRAFPDDQFMDSLFGNLFSQSSVAAMGLMVACLDLKIGWQVVLAALYYGIEVAFLALGVYEHHWFRSWMTSAGLLPLFWIDKWVYRKFNAGYGKVLEWVMRYLAFFTLDVVLFGWSFFVVPGLVDYNKTLLPWPGASWDLAAMLLYAVLFVCCNLAYQSRSAVWKFALLSGCGVVIYLLYSWKILFLKEGWLIPYTAITLAIGYLTAAYLGRYIRKNEAGGIHGTGG